MSPRGATTLSRPVGCVPCRATRFTDIRRFESIDSTNRYLLDEARARGPRRRGGGGRPPDRRPGAAGPAVGGPGRIQPAGVGAAPPRPPRRPPAPGQCGGGPGRRRGRQAVAGLRVGIKWPNDLLGADGRKVAGVLAEADLAPAAGRRRRAAAPAIVVGIGINVNWPAVRRRPARRAGRIGHLAVPAGRAPRGPGRAPRRPARGPRAPGGRSGGRRPDGPGRPASSGPGAPPSAPRSGWSWPTAASRAVAADVTAEGHLVVEVAAPPGRWSPATWSTCGTLADYRMHRPAYRVVAPAPSIIPRSCDYS